MRIRCLAIVLASIVGSLSACEEESTSARDDGSDEDGGSLAADANADAEPGVCDTDCLADRILAFFLSYEPLCRCYPGLEDVVLTQENVDMCADQLAEEALTFVSPRECVARHYTEPAAASELDAYLTCSEARFRERGPCIMALQVGDACDECPELYDDGTDPCERPDEADDFFEECLSEMRRGR